MNIMKKGTNLNCEDRVVTDILTKIAKRTRESIHSDKTSNKIAKKNW